MISKIKENRSLSNIFFFKTLIKSEHLGQGNLESNTSSNNTIWCSLKMLSTLINTCSSNSGIGNTESHVTRSPISLALYTIIAWKTNTSMFLLTK